MSLPPLGTKVAIVGDSLTEGVRTRITPFATRYGFDAKIDAQTGRDIEAGLSPLKKIVTGATWWWWRWAPTTPAPA